jgi:type II secretory pathway component PulK
MNRRGVALLVVLWLLVALSALGAVSLGTAREGSAVSRNRIWLRRAEWAREACGEILMARWADRSFTERPDRLVNLDSTDLGRGSWCSARLENPNAKLNLNTADPSALGALLGDESLTDALLDWRDPDSLVRDRGAEADWYRARQRKPPRNGPLASVLELRSIKGFDSATVSRLDDLVTTEGDGGLDLNAAPAKVLQTLPGFDSEVIDRILARRARHQPYASLGELVGELSRSAQRKLLGSYQVLQQITVLTPPAYLALLEGRVAGTGIRARATLTLVPVDHRLALIRRRVE